LPEGSRSLPRQPKKANKTTSAKDFVVLGDQQVLGQLRGKRIRFPCRIGVLYRGEKPERRGFSVAIFGHLPEFG